MVLHLLQNKVEKKIFSEKMSVFLTKYILFAEKNVFIWKKSFILKIFFTEKTFFTEKNKCKKSKKCLKQCK